MAQDWNRQHCQPPLDSADVAEKVSRKWAEWSEGSDPDVTPESLGAVPKVVKERSLLTASDLLDLDDDPDSLWLVKNVLIRGGIHFLSAPPASGKSWVLLDLARAMTGNVPWLGSVNVPQGAVLYVDEEMGKQMASVRVRKLGFSRDTPFYYLGKEGINIQMAEDCRYLLEVVKEKNIQLVILDTLTGVRPGLKENESEHVSQLRTVFNQICGAGATLLIAHHDRKGRIDEDQPAHEKMRGSGDIAGMADMAYGISKKNDGYTIKATKNRATSDEDMLNLEFELRSESDGRLSIYPLDEEERGKKRLDAMSMRILSLFEKNRELNTTQIVEALGAQKSTVVLTLASLVERMELEYREGPKNAKIYSLSTL
jgi:hypothetical protein